MVGDGGCFLISGVECEKERGTEGRQPGHANAKTLPQHTQSYCQLCSRRRKQQNIKMTMRAKNHNNSYMKCDLN